MIRFTVIENGERINKVFNDIYAFRNAWYIEGDLPDRDTEIGSFEIMDEQIVFEDLAKLLMPELWEDEEPVNRRKVLFTDGMTEDYLIIITDAPKNKIESCCRAEMKDEQKEITFFESIKENYYVKVLLDHQSDDYDSDDAELIGWNEVYDFNDYYED